MPTRRKRKLLSKKKHKYKKKYVWLIILLSLLIIGIYYILRTNKWNGNNKLSLVVRNNDDSLSVLVFDPEIEEIYKLNIPGNTEIEVAGNLGLWKIKSLWKLSSQEGLDGELVVRSITLGMNLPVYNWADTPALGLVEPGLKSFFNSVFALYETDLTLGDRLRLFVFSTKIENSKRVEINLDTTSFLEKEILADGEEGYRVSKTSPQNILAIFSEPELSGGVSLVSVINSSGSGRLARDVGEVIEVLGGKISSIDNRDVYDGVCILKTKREATLKIMLKIFECEKYLVQKDQSFDVEIVLGKKFALEY